MKLLRIPMWQNNGGIPMIKLSGILDYSIGGFLSEENQDCPGSNEKQEERVEG